MRTVLDLRTAGDRFPGIGRYAYNLARAMSRRKDRGELVLIHNPRSVNTRFDVAALESEPDVKIAAAAVSPLTAGEQLRLPSLLRSLAPDVTHFPSWMVPCAAPRPFVLTIHDIIPLRLPQHFPARRRLLFRASLALSLRFAACAICMSQATRSDLESVFRGIHCQLEVIPEGVGEPFGLRAKNELDAVRRRYELPDQFVLCVGSNKPHKNLSRLVDAYARLGRTPPLILAGREDPRYPQVRRRVEQLGLGNRVRFMGAVPEEDLPALYGNAMAFVFPSLYEGFGLPPLEAMAGGTPVACSEIPSLREAVGEAALRFDPSSPDSIASALQRILEDEKLRERLRAAGLRRAAELTWDLAAQKTLDVLRQAC
jgi:alpha-1,3-rhamnosyl/mannosyltransferase